MSIAKKLVIPSLVAIGGFVGVGGGSLLSNITANAATPSAAATSSTTSTATTDSPVPAHGTSTHETAEATVTGDNASKAQAAAVKYVGSGTAGEVTSDYTKSGYETTVTKSDGTTVEVHLDSSFSVMQGGHGGTSSSSN